MTFGRDGDVASMAVSRINTGVGCFMRLNRGFIRFELAVHLMIMLRDHYHARRYELG
jgi:hypothetical protein